jgi:hypothetical protein
VSKTWGISLDGQGLWLRLDERRIWHGETSVEEEGSASVGLREQYSCSRQKSSIELVSGGVMMLEDVDV